MSPLSGPPLLPWATSCSTQLCRQMWAAPALLCTKGEEAEEERQSGGWEAASPLHHQVRGLGPLQTTVPWYFVPSPPPLNGPGYWTTAVFLGGGECLAVASAMGWSAGYQQVGQSHLVWLWREVGPAGANAGEMAYQATLPQMLVIHLSENYLGEVTGIQLVSRLV